MTTKEKIKVLTQTKKRFQKLVKELSKDKYAYRKLGEDGMSYGICNYAYFMVMKKTHGFSELGYGEYGITEYFQREFKIKMPANSGVYGWPFTINGYQARIKAINNAIKKLQQ